MADEDTVPTTGDVALDTVEEIIEKVTHTTTPQASTGVLLDWTIGVLESALGLGNHAATADAVATHVAALKANKDQLSTAVAANS